MKLKSEASSPLKLMGNEDIDDSNRFHLRCKGYSFICVTAIFCLKIDVK